MLDENAQSAQAETNSNVDNDQIGANGAAKDAKGANGRANSAAESGTEQAQSDHAGGDPTAQFDTWLAAQDERTRTLVTTALEQRVDVQVKGLKSALAKERDQAKALDKQLRDIQKLVPEEDSVQAAIKGLRDSMKATQAISVFYESAHAKGVTDLRLAWLAASDAKLVNGDGEVDWDTFKSRFPALWPTKQAPQPVPQGNAGAGMRRQPSPFNMDEFIRKTARGSPQE